MHLTCKIHADIPSQSPDTLSQANIIHNEQIGKLTDTVGNQIKSDGLLGGIGDAMSSEGVDRYEREQPGMEKKTGGYAEQAQKGGQAVTDGVGNTVGGITGGLGLGSKK